MMDINNVKLSEIDKEESKLIFERFGLKEAHVIGLYLVKMAQEKTMAITIDIQIGQHQVFHYACEGTNEENDEWIIRKNNVARHFKKSSFYISRMLIDYDKNISEDYNLDESDYAPFGGSVPILVEERGMVGTITVSGLLDHIDHEVVVKGIKWYLSK